jgi:hypothetical protein
VLRVRGSIRLPLTTGRPNVRDGVQGASGANGTTITNEAASDALDPFEFEVDLDCED